MFSLIKNIVIKSSVSWILVLILMVCNVEYSFALNQLSDKEIYDLKNEIFALYETNNKDAAMELIKQIPNSKKDNELYIIEANILEDISQDAGAIESLNKSILKNSENYKAYYNIGCILLKKKSYELAIKNFKKSLDYKKDFPFAHYNLACAYIGLEEYKKAKNHLIRAINLKNDEQDFHYNLAYCYKKLGDEKTAQKILDELSKN